MFEIVAPLSGVIVPLESVPDSVFAGKLVGDGVAIDPTSSEVLSPIAGRVTQLHAARHAVAVTGEAGVEVLVHVGLDTVLQKGEGFTALVPLGAEVARGQPLLRFDADRVACAARSLLTEVIVTSPERVANMSPAAGLAQAGHTVVLRLELRDHPTGEAPAGPAAPPAPPAPPAPVVRWSEPVPLPNLLGLHARPSAVLASEARRFAADLRLVRGAIEANAKSVVAIMGLAAQQGDVLRVKATGADAEVAAARLEALLASGSGEAVAAGPGGTPAPAVPVAEPVMADELAGAPTSPGWAVGRILQHRPAVVAVAERGGTPSEERARLAAAVGEATLQIEALKRQAAEPSRAGILDVQIALLEDPDLTDAVRARLEQGKSAAFAWREAYQQHAARLEQTASPLLRERATDVRDVGARVMGCLQLARSPGGAERAEPVAAPALDLPPDAILVAEEITPSEMAALSPGQVAGICTTTGSSTSHVAILARSLGLPAICAIDPLALRIADGTSAVIDGESGVLRLRPDEAVLQQARDLVARQSARRAEEGAAAHAPARTRDGRRVPVLANIASPDDARRAIAGGAEGVGLLRSEFLFYDRDTPPTEAEQERAYGEIGDLLAGRPLVIRSLDVGGDKPISYLPLPREGNPFLGLRGIRVSLDRPDLLRSQLRALLRAARGRDLQVMFPMISGLDEVRAARRILDEVQHELRAEREPGGPSGEIKVGVMIEVPSAVILAELLAREVDFFSIGTNDLTQYTLAMDRGHPMLAKQADALHPAVVRMIAATVEGARRHGRPVGVCGGIASEPLAVPLLVGLGVDELSVSVPAVAAVKAALARWSMAECQSLAGRALALGTATEVRALLSSAQPEVAPQGPAPLRVSSPLRLSVSEPMAKVGGQG